VKKGVLLVLAAILLPILITACDALKDSDGEDSSYLHNVTGLAAGLADRSVSLSWNDPDDASFRSVEISGDGFSTVSVAKGVGTAVIADLINGIGYKFTVKAVDSSGGKSTGAVLHAAPFGNVADLLAATAYNMNSKNNVCVLHYGKPKAEGFSGVEIGGSGIDSFFVSVDGLQWGETEVPDIRIGESASFSVKVVDAYGNKQAEGASVTFVPGLVLNSKNLSAIIVGATKTINATIDNLAVTPSWTSADPAVATVDASGVVTGVSAGLTRITATSGIFTASCGIAVLSQGAGTLTFTTTPGNPDPVFGYNQVTGIIVSSGLSLPLEVSCTKTSGSLISSYGIEVRQTVLTDVVRYRLEILPVGLYRIRRSVTDQVAVVIVPWTEHTAILSGLSQTNTLRITQPSAGSLGFIVNGTTLNTIADPYAIDFMSANASLYVRMGVASSYALDYSAVGKETVAFAY